MGKATDKICGVFLDPASGKGPFAEALYDGELSGRGAFGKCSIDDQVLAVLGNQKRRHFLVPVSPNSPSTQEFEKILEVGGIGPSAVRTELDKRELLDGT